MYYELLIIGAGIGGLLTALYVYWRRRRGPMTCIVGEGCDDVLQSAYVTTIFFGIPNDIVGILYFAGIIGFFGTAFFYPTFITPMFQAFAVFGTGLGALYAFYLTGIQAFVLKKWCEKCLVLSFFTLLVFMLVLKMIQI